MGNFKDATKDGYEVVSRFPGNPYVLINRKTSFQPWIAAYGYDEEEGTWNNGHYFNRVEDAISFITGSKTYVYREYNDRYDVGEEVLELYAREEDAMNRLKASVEAYFGKPFDKIEKGYDPIEDEVVENYIEYDTGNDVLHWSVEEKEIIK